MTSRSRAAGARISKVTRTFEDQNWRSPMKSLRASAKLSSSTGVSGRTTTAKSAVLAGICAGSRASRVIAASLKTRLVRELGMQLEGETRLYECAVDPRLSRSALIAVFELDRGEV